MHLGSESWPMRPSPIDLSTTQTIRTRPWGPVEGGGLGWWMSRKEQSPDPRGVELKASPQFTLFYCITPWILPSNKSRLWVDHVVLPPQVNAVIYCNNDTCCKVYSLYSKTQFQVKKVQLVSAHPSLLLLDWKGVATVVNQLLYPEKLNTSLCMYVMQHTVQAKQFCAVLWSFQPLDGWTSLISPQVSGNQIQ